MLGWLVTCHIVAPVLSSRSGRDSDAHGRGFVLHLQMLPEVTAAGSLEESVAALNRGVEAAVRSLPAQYLWAYKRFKTRPPGTPKLPY